MFVFKVNVDFMGWRGILGFKSFTGLSLEFCTHLSTEKVNKTGLKGWGMFITLPISVSYPNVIRPAAP
ncbi:hypothetical protein FUU19_17880 [Serratia sp. Lou2A]|uniref:Uncharacterized protein n=1 Tax=Serratia montpellierensis TaxID=2598730 RepID=A0ABS8JC67_9GAMM|nr:hypothetical protein [Serratia sp. Lou2A]MCC7661613.1 hypothetical protein [Serratia sp. Pon4B]